MTWKMVTELSHKAPYGDKLGRRFMNLDSLPMAASRQKAYGDGLLDQSSEDGSAGKDGVICEVAASQESREELDDVRDEMVERSLVKRLDSWMMVYVCVAYLVKYLDQTNVQNAYVSGMKEDLGMHGNQYNYLISCWTLGYMLGQLPSQIILCYVRASIWLPLMELLWGISVFVMAFCNDIRSIYILRFAVGLFEASMFPAVMLLLGNWYEPQELGKRASIFQMFSSVASAIGGYLQSGLYNLLNGKLGLHGWQWLFLFDGFITLPVAFYGFTAIPDSPTNSRVWWLTSAELDSAVLRMSRIKRAAPKKFHWNTFKQVFTSWPVYLFSAAFTFHILGIRLYTYMGLWLKSTGKYSVGKVNTLPSYGYLLQIVFTSVFAILSDKYRNRWLFVSLLALPAILGASILVYWPEHSTFWMFTGWYLLFCETGAGALLMAWISEVIPYSNEQRAIVLGTVPTVSFVFQCWVPLLIYNAGDAPHYKYGYHFAALCFALEAVLSFSIYLVHTHKVSTVRESSPLLG